METRGIAHGVTRIPYCTEHGLWPPQFDARAGSSIPRAPEGEGFGAVGIIVVQ